MFVAQTDTDNTAAFAQALTLASETQAQLSVVAVVDTTSLQSGSTYYTHLLDTMVSKSEELLHSLVEGKASLDPKIETKVLIGRGFVEIIREVLREDCELIIKAVDQRESTTTKLFGGTDLKLLRKCPCPVWLIKTTEQEGDREVLVALDMQPDNPENEALNRRLLEVAAFLALAEFSALHIVHVWKMAYESYLRGPRTSYSDADVDKMIAEEEAVRTQWLTELVDAAPEFQTSDYIKPELHIVKGDAKSVIPELAKKLGVELVIMGTVARTGVPGLLIGNTAETILSQLDHSVLALKPDGFVSPITL